jgi:chemosensory pili system protein ChpA (sensor histidine kinase/response regulator)
MTAMEPASQVAPQTLDLIGRELNATLADARAPLEAFIEQPENYSLLERSAAELHRVQGVLRVLEIYGAALLAEEMEQVARYIVDSAEERKSPAESLDALLRAMVQLPSYLDRVLAGGRDLALVLLPLLNDLRAVRGSPLLSEGTLLLLNLKSDRRPESAPPVDISAATPNVTLAARRLRAQFQLGLVGWIRGEREAEHLATLASVSQQMEQIATQQSVFQLWWVVGAVIEALAENGLDSSVSVKRLLGLADRELKRLYEQGEPRYCQTPPVELLNNLLYYVARASSYGPRVSAVRASFRLDELLPVDQSVEEERDTLSAPSIKLMQTVAAAIREDLGKVKDTLDIFVRRGSGQAAELGPQVELLRKIGDTLGVLGLGELRDSIQRELQRLEDIVAERSPATEAVLIDIATTLINVEDRLDSSLLRLIVPRQEGAHHANDASAPSEEFLHVQAAVLRECAVNLARIKEAVAQNVGGTLDAAGLDAWPELLRGIKAGLLLLGRMRAVHLIEQIGECLQRVMQPGGGSLPTGYMDRLADAIVSVEYYMETLQAGRAEPDYMLDNAQGCIDALRLAPMAQAPTVPPLSASVYAKTVLIDPSGATLGLDPERTDNLAPTMLAPALRLPAGGATLSGETSRRLRALGDGTGSFPRAEPPVLAPAAPPPALPVAAAAPPAPVTADTDPELLEIFIEEAREEVARIEQYFPEWDRNPGDGAALAVLRRSFHTLKGSGRMVGARPLAEFSWAIENLLNRLIDGTVERSPPVSATLREAVALVPQLVEHLAGGAAPGADPEVLAARAHSLAAAQPAETETQLGLTSASGAPTRALADDSATVAAAVPVAALEPRALSAADQADADMHDALEVTQPGFSAPPPSSPSSMSPAPGMAPTQFEPVPDDAASVDTTLRDIYLRETDTHVEAVRSFIAGCRGKPAPHELDEPVYRACHTLSGSSKMAEARHGIRLAEPLDRWLRKSWGSGVGLVDEDLDLLADCMTAMQQVARHMDESTQFFLQHDLLRERVARADAALDRRIAEAAEAENVEISAPAEGDDDATGEVPALAAPAAFAAVAAPVEPEPAAPPPAEPEPEASLDADFDPEIASIFLDEASELIDASQAALQDWNDVPDDAGRIAALKRPLHTLKGGARMAGIASMGDLAHELETLIGQLELGLVASVDAARHATQASVDELARMRDQVAQGRSPRAASDLIGRLQALGRGETVDSTQRQPALAPLVASDAESVEATGGETALVRALELPAPQLYATSQAATQAEAVEAVAEAAPVAAPVAPVAPVAEPPAEPSVAAAAVEGAGSAATLVVPPGREPVPQADRQEMARVDADLLDQLLNQAGEVSIGRARLEQQVSSIDHNLGELSRTVTRLKEQLRNLEIETEKQILHRYENDAAHRGDFDPLELDRYSSIQQFSRALAETASDVASIQQLLESLTQDTTNLLQQQARTVTELQNGLMRTRMVPFQRHAQRLQRIVRQAAADSGRQAELLIEGASGELDRQVLERMLPPFEHILRNAVVHGIELPAERVARGKAETGKIQMLLRREGSEVVVEIQDDGAGMNIAAIRAKGVALGLVRADEALSDGDVMQLVLEPGFSTAATITQQAGRGVGMDVVATEVKKLGGALHMDSTAGEGTRFTIRLPLTLAISHALVVRVEDELYALPLPTVEGVVRLSRDEVAAHLAREGASFEYGGQTYRLQQLGMFVGLTQSPLPAQDVTVPVVLVRAGDHSTGLVTDELIGSREIVVKSVGPQISGIRGISGATILGDGRIVIILDISALVRADWRSRAAPVAPREKSDTRAVALVVDDSITVRRVTQRLLERNGVKVLTARDGLDAVAVLAEHVPDVILLDIEMPRMDGYEVAAHVRNDPRLRDVPIIMITSRVGEKHRARAIELGVSDYLGKPYQEAQLLEAIEPLIAERRRGAGHG